jgi:hypothetical protein
MATAAEIRRWAIDQGLDVPGRGPLPPHLTDAYDAWHGTDNDIDDGQDAEPGPPPADTAERKPRSIRTPRAASWRNRARGKGKARPRAKHPRVPVDDLIAGLWRGAAGFARPLPPTSRLMKIQAPVAGAILEDVVKGTAIDRLLQPLARTTAGAEALFALAGPPIMVTALQLQPDMEPFIMPLLRESLLRWCKIAGPKMKEALAREKEFEDEFGATVDDMIAMLFAPPGPLIEEDQQVRSMQENMQPGAA